MKRVTMAALAAACTMAWASGQMNFSLTSDQQQYRPGEPIRLTWKLHNATDRSWVVYSDTTASRHDFDQVSLNIKGPSGARTLLLTGERTASSPHACRLPAGDTLQFDFDLSGWAKSYNYPMPPGVYSVSAIFSHRADVWRPMLKEMGIGNCGSAGGTIKKPEPSEIWDGVLTSPQISITIR